MDIGLNVKYPLFLADFNQPWTFSTDFRKMFKYQISWKSVQWEPFHADGHRHDEPNGRFSQFCECAQ